MRKFITDILAKASLGVEQNAYVLGTVGIGTTTPQRKLHVAGDFAVNASGSQYYGVYIPANGEGASPTILIGDWWNASGNLTWDSSNKIFNINSLYGSNAAPITFSGNGTERMRISSDGNVGIGTTIFDLWGFGNYGGGSISHKSIIFGGNTYVGTQVGTNISAINFAVNNTTSSADIVNRIVSVITDTTNNSESGYLSFYTKSGAISTASQERMRIASSGAVQFNAYGAGTFTGTRAYDLSVDASGNIIEVPVGAGTITGSGTTNYVSKFTGASSIGDSVLYDDGTDVGIGTTSPAPYIDGGAARGLQINNAGRAGIRLHDTGGVVQYFDIGINGNTAFISAIYSQTATIKYQAYSEHIFETNSSERMRITSAGNVGIGTTSPSAKLDVSGTGRFNASDSQLTLSHSGGVYSTVLVTNSIGNFYIQPGGSFNALTIASTGAATFSSSVTLNARESNLALRMQYPDDPNYRLDISQVVTSGLVKHAFNVVNAGTAYNNNLVLDRGNVGIGTTSPSAKFVVSDGGAAGIELQPEQTTDTNRILNYDRATATYMNLRIDANTHQFMISGFERMRLDSSGNLGLGVTPSAWGSGFLGFDIGGTTATVISSLSRNIIASNSYYDGTNYIYKVSDYALQQVLDRPSGAFKWNIAPSGIAGNAISFTQAMTLDASGRLGIGTTAPSQKLEVKGVDSSTVQAIFQANAGAAVAYNGGIQLGDGTGNQNSQIYHNSSGDNTLTFVSNYSSGTANKFIFAPGGTERVRFLQNGNVGIGTSNPSARLSLGAASQGNRITWEDYSNIFSEYSSGDIWLSSNFYGNLGSSGYVTSSTASWGAAGISVSGTGGGLNGVIKFFVDDAAAKTAGAAFVPTERMRLTGTILQLTTAASNQGIIQLSNSSSYQIRGGGTYGYISLVAPILRFDANGSEAMRITSGGNVGIGTTSPSRGLTINRTNEFAALNIIKNNTGNQIAYLGTGSGGADDLGILQLLDGGAVKVQIYTGGSSWFNGGNVGIGTTSPAYKLDVSGNIYGTLGDSTFILSDSNNYARFTSLSGNAQIGLFRGSPSDGVYIGGSNQGFLIYNSNFSSVLLKVAQDGNVGIGTTSPAYTLDVAGGSGFRDTLRIVSSGTETVQLSWTSTNNGVINVLNGGSVTTQILASGNSYFNGGNVGIGTTSPYGRLELNGSGQSWTTAPAIRMWDSFNSKGWLVGNVNNYTPGDFYIRTLPSVSGVPGAGQQEFTIKHATGNVGIGTASPGAKLTVAGPQDTTGDVLVFNIPESNQAANTDNLRIYNDYQAPNYNITDDLGGVLQIGTRGGSPYWSLNAKGGATFATSAGNVGIGTTSPQVKFSVQGAQNNTIAPVNGVAKFVGGDAGVFIGNLAGTPNYGAWIQAMRESDGLTFPLHLQPNGGNVGIGTTSPAYKLQVAGDIGFTGAMSLKWGSNTYIYGDNNTQLEARVNSNLGWYINSAGNVGIGTTSPGYKLEVNGGSVGNNIARFTTGGGSGGTRGLYVYSNDSYVKLQVNDNAGNVGSWAFMSLNPDGGNVGIGITNPGHKLHVVGAVGIGQNTNGTATIDAYGGKAYYGCDGTQITVAGNTGNVGIGTTSPGYKLEVAGTSYFSGLAHFGQTASSGSAFRWGAFGTAVSSDTMLCHNQLWNGSGWTILDSSVGTGYMNLGGQLASPNIQFGTGAANTAASTKMIILNNGNVGIGTTSPSYKLHVEGNVSGISIYASHDIAAFSDITVKKEVKRIENAIEKVKELNGYTYVRTDDETGTRRAGVIAQEVQKVLPEVVSANPDGTLNVAYSNMIALLIEGMKEQQATIEKLENRIKILEK